MYMILNQLLLGQYKKHLNSDHKDSGNTALFLGTQSVFCWQELQVTSHMLLLHTSFFFGV